MPLSPEGSGAARAAPKQRRAGRGPRPTPKGQRPCQRRLLARSRAEDGDGLKASSQRAREEQERRPTQKRPPEEAAVGIGSPATGGQGQREASLEPRWPERARRSAGGCGGHGRGHSGARGRSRFSRDAQLRGARPRPQRVPRTRHRARCGASRRPARSGPAAMPGEL